MKKIVNTFTKIFVRDGKRHRIVAVASLGDECRNNICTHLYYRSDRYFLLRFMALQNLRLHYRRDMQILS